jgi:hypothetical protein
MKIELMKMKMENCREIRTNFKILRMRLQGKREKEWLSMANEILINDIPSIKP